MPGVAGYFDKVELKVVQVKQYKYLLADISAAIKQYWERRREGKVLKFSKPKATWSVFATDVKFDDEASSDRDDTIATAFTATRELKLTDTNTKNKIKNKRRKNNRERRNNNNITNQNQSQLRGESQRDKSHSPVSETYPHPRRANRAEKRDKKQVCEPFSACDSTTHSFTKCYLVKGQDKDWIPEKNWETFRNNMKVATVKKRVDDFRTWQKSFEDWRCTNGSIVKEKIIGRVSVLLR